MRCCVSPTTSTAADSARAQQVVDAILFREILKPLVRDLGPLAETALGSVADELFVRRPR